MNKLGRILPALALAGLWSLPSYGSDKVLPLQKQARSTVVAKRRNKNKSAALARAKNRGKK